jgi:hypothetical protein
MRHCRTQKKGKRKHACNSSRDKRNTQGSAAMSDDLSGRNCHATAGRPYHQLMKLAHKGTASRTGTVWVNEIHAPGVDTPFSGHKESGMSVESGHEGLLEFTNSRTYTFAKQASGR